ncbi:MAG: DEAD/DEAH box helicase family protein [Patescibacteria group bacterium]|nr:DEAD/DEAH box helicase family protein [Patescibacteria group bacterium]
MPTKGVAAPIAFVGPYGMRVARDAFAARCGDRLFAKILASLTVKERPQRGRKKMYAVKVRRAYYVENRPGPGSTNRTPFLFLPRIKADPLRRAGLVSKVVADRLVEPRALSEEAAAFAPPDELFGYQTAAITHVCDRLFSPARRAAHLSTAYVNMGTGLGKTRTAVGVICRMRVATVVVVPTIGIGEQWLDEFQESCPGMRCAMYRHASKGGRIPETTAQTHDVVVCVINTFHTKDDAFMAGFGMVVIDEAHELHSAKFGLALWLAQTRFVLGLSATPVDRPDGLDLFVPKHLGAVVWQHEIPGFDISDAVFQGEAWRIEYTGHPEHCETAVMASGTVSAQGTIANLMGDPHRNRLIVDTAVRLFGMHETDEAAEYGLGVSPDDPPDAPVRRHGVMIMSEHREALIGIRKLLLERFAQDEVDAPELDTEGKKPGRSISVLRGGVAKDELKKARGAGAHIVLCTYGYARRGISLVDMTCLIELSPRRNGQMQILGRVERRGSDQRIVRVKVDIIDVRTALKGQAGERLKVYKAKGYKIVNSKVSYEDIALE